MSEVHAIRNATDLLLQSGLLQEELQRPQADSRSCKEADLGVSEVSLAVEKIDHLKSSLF